MQEFNPKEKIEIIKNSPIYFLDIFHWLPSCGNKQLVIITDSNVAEIYLEKFKKYLLKNNINTKNIVFPAGEKSKSRKMKEFIENKLFSYSCNRDTCLVALGGGVVSDLVGFVAATFCRGIPVIYIPTTLLSMVDAAIGGKTGINTKYGKNLIGSFYFPIETIIDINFLLTLPDEEYFSAFAEIIKHALIYDKEYFEYIKNNLENIKNKNLNILLIIKKSCEIKSLIVASDEREKNKRELLNFGHTIGHAIEKISNYKVSHGSAVARGIVVESYISMKMGLLSSEEFGKIEEIIYLLVKNPPSANALSPFFKGGELNAPPPPPFEKALAHFEKGGRCAQRSGGIFKRALLFDKKTRMHQPRFVLLQKIGEPFVEQNNYAHGVPEEIIDQACAMFF